MMSGLIKVLLLNVKLRVVDFFLVKLWNSRNVLFCLYFVWITFLANEVFFFNIVVGNMNYALFLQSKLPFEVLRDFFTHPTIMIRYCLGNGQNEH